MSKRLYFLTLITGAFSYSPTILTQGFVSYPNIKANARFNGDIHFSRTTTIVMMTSNGEKKSASQRLLSMLPSRNHLGTSENTRQKESKAAIPVAGVHDALSARVLTQMLAPVVFVSGFGVTASRLGAPDAGIITRTEMEDATRSIISSTGCCSSPSSSSSPCIIVDGDTGYGGAANVQRTIRGMASIGGVSAITIEDQKFPKKCTYAAGKDINVVSRQSSISRIRTALKARDEASEIDGNDILVIARTDCRMALGFNEAVERCQHFEALGADIVYAENLQSVEEYKRLREILQPSTPMMLAQVQTDQQQTDLLSVDEIGSLGYDLALFGVTALQATVQALQTTASLFLGDGGGIIPSSSSSSRLLSPFEEVKRVVGFPELNEFESKFGCE